MLHTITIPSALARLVMQPIGASWANIVGLPSAHPYAPPELSHVLRKRPILERDEVAPLGEGKLAPARAMLREDLVALDTAEAAEHRLARQVVREVSEAFGTPLFARVDLVIGPGAEPLLLEFEAIEPHLYLTASAGAAQRLADAVRAS